MYILFGMEDRKKSLSTETKGTRGAGATGVGTYMCSITSVHIVYVYAYL